MIRKTIPAFLLIAALSLAGCSHKRGTAPIAQPDTVAFIPAFANECAVTIAGYSGDAMEPFISRDGQTLFFNSLNDGVNTSLFWASRAADTAFTLRGEVRGANGAAPHLDAVASLDDAGRFYFVSTRNWPAVLQNLQAGAYDTGAVTGVAPVPGDFYVAAPGWLVMDAEVSRDGGRLYYANARFSGGALPDEARLGVAARQGASFARLAAGDSLLAAVNDTAYLVYAPCSTPDGRELYFTRLYKRMTVTQICVAVRADTADPFGAPRVLAVTGSGAEAATITPDKRRLYYHKLGGDGKYHIFTMDRTP